MPRLHFPARAFPLALLLTPLLASACGDASPEPEDELRPTVVTSIFPMGDLLQWMVGEEANVEVLLPVGASPHTFEVTPRQMQSLQGAGIFVMIGGGLDEWVARLPGASGGEAVVLRLADVVPLVSGGHDHGSGNPHIWLDPILVRDRILPVLQGALEEHLSLAPEGLEERTRALRDSLTVLDQEIRGALDPLEKRAFVAAHPAWIYFAERYGLEEVGVVHSHSGMDPSSRELAHLLEVARARGVDCVFMEPQMGEVAVQALASELARPTCILDPLGGPGLEERDGYLQLLRFNTRQFVLGLGQGQE